MSQAQHIRNSADAYLRAIWALSFPTGDPTVRVRGPRPTAPARIAERLDVTRASCGEMLARLEERGLVARGERKEALLTSEGRTEAMRLVRRLRIVECMVVEVLGYSPHEAFAHARQLVEGFSDDAIDRLFRHLGEPRRTPLGVPVDPDFELREDATLHSLADVPAGVDAFLVRIEARGDADLRAASAAGLLPGRRVRLEVTSRAGAVTPPSVDGDDRVLASIYGGTPVALTSTLLRACFVRDEGAPEVPARATCWASSTLVSGGAP